MMPIKGGDVKVGDVVWLSGDAMGDATKSLYLAVNHPSKNDRVSFLCLEPGTGQKEYRCRLDVFHWWERKDLVRITNIYEGKE